MVSAFIILEAAVARVCRSEIALPKRGRTNVKAHVCVGKLVSYWFYTSHLMLYVAKPHLILRRTKVMPMTSSQRSLRHNEPSKLEQET